MATPWVEIVDPRSQELMYANIKTGDCSWEPPEGAEVRKMTDDQWWELYDSECECYYYYCAASQQTVWERPEDAEVIPLSKLQSFQETMPSIEASPSPGTDRRARASFQETVPRSPSPREPDDTAQMSSRHHLAATDSGDDGLVVSSIDDVVIPSENGHVGTRDEDVAAEQAQQAAHTSQCSADGVNTVGEQVDPTSATPATGYADYTQDQYGDQQHQEQGYDQSQAGYDESQAGYDQSQAGYDESQAGYDQSQAGYDESQAGYDESQAGYDQSQAGYDESQAGYDQSQAGYDQSQAGYDQSQAGYDQSQTGYDQSQAGYDESQAGYDQSQAGYDQSQAGYDQSQYADDAAGAAVDEGVASGPRAPPAAPSLPEDGTTFNIGSYDKFEKPKARRSFFSFKKKVTMENLLSWTKDPISSPMLRTNDKKRRKEAIELFKFILIYMGDKRSRIKDKERDSVLHEIIGRTWSTQQLRDELFVQLCRQTTSNKNKKSLHSGWEVMCSALSFFPPSSMFHSYLEGYVYRHLSAKPITDVNKADPVHVYAQYCTKRLEQMRISGPKKGQKKPSLEEVEHARELPFNPSMFGDTLRDVFEMQLDKYPDSRVPWILSTLAKQVLELNAKGTEGIFRVPGDIDEVNNLKLRIDRFELGELRDPHIPASLLKLWFRELLDPVIPPEFYDRCIRCAGERNEVLAIVDELPDLNRNVLCYIIHFLQQFTPATVSYYTKMDINNLAMVWAPNCLRCPYDDPTVLFENTRKEMTFVRALVKELDTSQWDGIDL